MKLDVQGQDVSDQACDLPQARPDEALDAAVGAFEALEARVLVAQRGAEPGLEVALVPSVAHRVRGCRGGRPDEPHLVEGPGELGDGEV